jgi:hypothetical protein
MMALREDQIVRYGRQILLRELGGRGQERLLQGVVRVLGSGPAIDDAVAYLLAGGSPVVLPAQFSPGGFLTNARLDAAAPASPPSVDLVEWGVTSTSPAQVVVGAGIAFRTAQACAECWKQTLVQLGGGPGPPAVGSLAALAVQRLVLGWSAALGLLCWTGFRFEAPPLPSCDHP